MSDYEDVEEFRARFAQMQKTAAELLGQTAMFAARLHCDFDDPEASYVGDELAAVNQTMEGIVDRLHELPSHLY